MARSSNFDPIEKMRFTVTFDNGLSQSRAGFTSCSLPSESRGEISYREGNYADAHEYSAGLTTYGDISLSRGVTRDQDFYAWAEQHKKHKPSVRGNAGGAYTATDARPSDEAINDYRRDLTITLLDREGLPAKQWKVFNCWCKELVPGDNLDANAEEKLMNSITLKIEGFVEIVL